ncbi:MAG TPA: nucleoside diphosphate kinase regulator [Opitutaceae bacterium]|nr:nucleoside diphosphate kinase regulator [Opitutaceae bacterium]
MNEINTTTTLPALRISRSDHERLRLLVEAMGNTRPQLRESLQPLKVELERAEVLAPADVPPHVVKMGSRIELEDRETGEVDTYSLVYPEDADAAVGKVSVMAPIGMAVIGFAEGDTFSWKTPGGIRRLLIRKVS